MYVDIFFPLTKAIAIMFERVTTHYQTLQTWIDHACYHTRYLTPYRTFALNLAWFQAICNGIPCVTVKFIKKCILIFFEKN